MNCDVYACFVDFEKAFDRVKHDKMIDILRRTGIDDSDTRIIENLYWGQRAEVKVDDRLTDEIIIRRGVRQGCVLSPLLFNVYSGELIAEAFEELSEGISINGERVNNIRYADDIILLANTFEGMQTLLEGLVTYGGEYGLNLNSSKTKYMIISKSHHGNQQLVINHSIIQGVEHITYQGCLRYLGLFKRNSPEDRESKICLSQNEIGVKQQLSQSPVANENSAMCIPYCCTVLKLGH